jgi:hypothetical protein
VPGSLSALLAQLSGGAERDQVTPYVIVFAVGFLIAIAGHLTESRPLILAGIFIAGLAAVLPMVLWG